MRLRVDRVSGVLTGYAGVVVLVRGGAVRVPVRLGVRLGVRVVVRVGGTGVGVGLGSSVGVVAFPARGDVAVWAVGVVRGTGLVAEDAPRVKLGGGWREVGLAPRRCEGGSERGVPGVGCRGLQCARLQVVRELGGGLVLQFLVTAFVTPFCLL
jgi:hypothetical protein